MWELGCLGARVLVGCVYFLQFSFAMEEWRAQLDSVLAHALHDSDEEQEDMLVESFVCGGDYLESEEENTKKHRGSTLERCFVYRDREDGAERLFRDYFANDPLFDDATFRRKYRMRRDIFLRLVDAASTFDPWFRQSQDGLGRPGLSILQKSTAALHMLAYGSPAYV